MNLRHYKCAQVISSFENSDLSHDSLQLWNDAYNESENNTFFKILFRLILLDHITFKQTCKRASGTHKSPVLRGVRFVNTTCVLGPRWLTLDPALMDL